MALWGSSDNIVSAGIVTLTYATGVVQGEEFNSQFGQVGGAKTGDIIRFGLRDFSGLGTYFGDAPIISIASSTRLTIGNTMGLVENGPSIAGTDYYISELPISSVEDFSYSNRLDTGRTSVTSAFVGSATTNSEIGTDTVAVVIGSADVIVGDRLLNDSTNFVITAIGATAVTLASNITAGIATGDSITFSRLVDGYDKNVYGISTSAVAPAIYADAITHHGWVGIMTYTDMHGNLRVKSETLVAAGKDANGSGGITTGGNGIPYPSYA